MKKRLLALFMSLCLVVGLLPTAAWAADTAVSGGISWEIAGDTLTISAAGIPEAGYDSGEMPDYAYGQQPWNSERSSIQKIVIEDTVTNIGARAFQDTNAAAVTFGSGVTSIGNWAFRNTKLTNVMIPGNVKTLGSYIFQLTGTLETITVSDGVETIPDYCFQQATGLKTLNLPASIVSIGDAPLRQCAALETVTFGGAAQNDAGTYEVKDGMLIGHGTELIALLKEAAESTSLSVPDGTQKLGSYLLEGNKNVQTLNLPASLDEIGTGALSNCAVASFTVDPASTAFSAEDDVLYGANGSELIFYPKTKADTSFVIPDTVEIIKNGAFNSNAALTSVKFGAGVEEIEGQAFSGCTALSAVEFDSALKTIGVSAFQNTALTSISLPDATEEIGNYAFYRNNNPTLVYFSAGSGLKKVGQNAVAFKTQYNDSVLVDLTRLADNVELGSNAFSTGTGGGTNGYHQIYVKNDDMLSKVRSAVGGTNACYIVTTGGVVTTTSPTGLALAEVARDDAEFQGYIIKAATPSSGHQHNVGDAISSFNGCGCVKEIEAVWQSSIIFHANSGVGTMEAQTGTVGSSVTLPENSFTKAGYTFAGWNTQADGKGVNYEDQDTIQLSGNTTLFAQWVPVSYNITYELNGGAVETENPTTYTAEDTFTLNNPTKADYTFTGWTGSNGETAQLEVTVPVGSTGDKSYTANWSDRVLSGIEATANKTSFSYGTVLSADDFTVTAIYDNGEREEVSGYSILPDTVLTVPGTVDVKITYQGKEATCTITVDKAVQTAPDIPVLKDRTTTSIILETVEGAEYSCNGGAWQASPEFTDLTAGTTYTFQIRYAETDTHAASEPSQAAEFATLAQASSGGGGGSSRGNSYAVSTPKADNGSVTVNNGASAKKGDTVTITVKPSEGYEIGAVTVTDSKGNTITVTDKGDGKFSFTMPDSKVDVKATFVKTEVEPDQPSKTTFVDVPENSWYADAADFVAERGLMSGVGENLFGGSQNTTRAMLMTILARMDGQDVTGGATWYEKAMIWAKQTGVSDGTMPEVNITREQLATMLYSYAKLKGMDTTQGGMAVREFSDYDSISSWAGQSMAWAVNAGILSGRGNNTLAPTAGATRAEMAVMLQQFVGLMEK